MKPRTETPGLRCVYSRCLALRWAYAVAARARIAMAALIVALSRSGLQMVMDYDELERWTRVGYERGTRSRHGER
jgi:hypothetical protein